ncbi:hypothetical protein [Chryseobacterium sp. ISL-6]|uniref:hypothetical protein n=1 Tax=Chryseobacterium sp. ISL-6 TaxID=2819143 RepID=UPI001BE9AF74|nr:hypothetical protein [Chryseobacterium sp. ISL-6]MBT2622608.1 hypothetical protein [Chryseobacterium sp. ISL-6]
MKKITLLAITLSGILGNAQSAKDLTGSFSKNTKSPQATDFIRYGNIPIKKNIGELDLNIPLLSIPTQNGGKVSLDLNYNASGFIPDKKSGIVGFNWNLMSGGVITRTVVGEADDQAGSPQTGNGINGHYEHGYLVGIKQFGTNTSELPTDNDLSTINPNKLFGAVDNLNDEFFEVRLNGYPNTNSTRYETTSDKYSFNFNGISGSFFIAPDGKVEVVTSEPHKLKVDLSGMNSQPYTSVCSPLSESEIIITDEVGNKYYFGKESKNLEYNVFLGAVATGINAQTPVISGWYQYKTEYQNGDVLKYNYQADNIAPNNVYSSFCIINQNNFWKPLPQYSDLKKFLDLHSMGDSNSRQVFNLVKKAYLSNIEYKDYKIVFSYSDQDNLYKNVAISGSQFGKVPQKKLDKIQLYNQTNLTNTIDFGYEVYNAQYPRIFLKTVKEMGKEPYEFSYDTSSAANTPSPITFAVDYWGYYNGKTSNDAPFATPIIFPSVNYLSNGDYQYTSDVRESDFTYSKMYALQSVKYPTKGSSFFNYEPHSYSFRLERRSDNSFLPKLYSVNGIVGGTRLQKIYDYDLNANQNTREFIYTNDLDQSSGILTEWPRYFFSYNAQISGKFCSGGSGWLFCIPWSYDGQKLIQTASGYSRSLTEGAVISYSKVTEKFSGNGSTTDYFTTYIDKPDVHFDNSLQLTAGDYSPMPAVKNLLFMPASRSIERDKLSKRLIKDESGNLLEEQVYLYNEDPSRLDKYHISMNISNAWMNPLRNYYYNNFMSSNVTKQYLNNNLLSSKSEYFYQSANGVSLSKVKNTSTDGKVTETSYQYAHEKNNQKLIAANMIGIPLETTVVEKSNETAAGKMNSRSETKYDDPANLFPSSVLSYNVLDNTPSTEITYNKYDANGNLQQYTSKDGVPTAIVWGYNSTQPIAKVQGATYDQLVSLGLITAIVTASDQDAANPANEPALITALDTFRKNSGLSAYQVSTYTYDPLIGVTSITPPSGINEVYIYDTANRLKEIRQQEKDSSGNMVYKVVKEFKYNYKN